MHKFVILIIFSLFLNASKCNNDMPECVQISACTCLFPDETAIDLNSLQNSSPSLNFSVAANNSHIYFYSPCNDAAINKSEPTQVGALWLFTAVNVSTSPLNPVLALNNSINGSFTLLATTKQGQFLNTRVLLNDAKIQYLNNTLTSDVQLDCVHEGKNTLTMYPSYDPSVAHSLMLRGPAACAREPLSKKHHLSLGSILLIMFSTGGLIYFVLGALMKKILRGAEGPEMLPNHDFWMELPGLVKDGVAFALSCGRVRPDSYERI